MGMVKDAPNFSHAHVIDLHVRVLAHVAASAWPSLQANLVMLRSGAVLGNRIFFSQNYGRNPEENVYGWNKKINMTIAINQFSRSSLPPSTKYSEDHHHDCSSCCLPLSEPFFLVVPSNFADPSPPTSQTSKA